MNNFIHKSSFLILGLLTVGLVFAQPTTSQPTITIPTDTIYAALDTLNAGEISVHWDVTNETSADMIVMCTRTFIDTVSPFNYPYIQSTESDPVYGAYEKFCWGPLCYNFGTDASSTNSSLLETLVPGVVNNTFIAYYYPNGVVGTTTFEYCFHEVGDITAGNCQKLTYVISATAAINEKPFIRSSISSPYPNPITGTGWMDYNLQAGETGSIIFRDVTGKLIRKDEGLVNSGRVAIDGMQLPQGLCFCVLEIDGVAIHTERLVVIR